MRVGIRAYSRRLLEERSHSKLSRHACRFFAGWTRGETGLLFGNARSHVNGEIASEAGRPLLNGGGFEAKVISVPVSEQSLKIGWFARRQPDLVLRPILIEADAQQRST